MKRSGNIVGIIVVGIMFVFKSYVIVIGQTAKPVLVALNKAETNMAIIDPGDNGGAEVGNCRTIEWTMNTNSEPEKPLVVKATSSLASAIRGVGG